MPASRTMKWLTGVMELVLGIPLAGALIVIGFGYVPLFVMLILHIITFALSKSNGESSSGSILGIITSLIAWIPFVGMAMHLATAVTLFVSASRTFAPNPPSHPPVPPPPSSF
ncbi:hypothetical protein ACLBWT_17375 [Paenibacillus sp. D51F]